MNPKEKISLINVDLVEEVRKREKEKCARYVY